MTHERAQAIAEAAASRTSHRAGLPLRDVRMTLDGYGVATFDFFDRPGYTILQERFTRAGGQAVTFRTDGRQTHLSVWFLECAHE